MRNRRFALLACVTVFATLLLAGCSGQPSATAADGTQVIKVAAQGQFVPASAAKAGSPIRLEFGAGGGCTAAVQFKDQGIFEDLTDGGGVVDLPALEPGTYPLICQSDMVMGNLTVE